MAKIAIICVVVVVCIQMALASPRIARDAPEKKPDVSKEIDDVIGMVKDNFQMLFNTIQNNEMVKEVNQRVQQLGADVAVHGKQLAEKIQKVAQLD